MASDRWQRLAALYETAASLPPERRAAYLEDVTAGDPALRREVEALLAVEGLASDALKAAVGAAARDVTEHVAAGPRLEGRRIGPYEITEELAHGGMGTVYGAVRADDAYKKTVAIKVIRRWADDPEVRRRFVAERQILATLDHPHIARLLDGGTTVEGLPYVVMERVAGERLDVYCDSRTLSIAARLRLFLKVCDAVQYAHHNLIVHRDLKPANILVSAEGEPKLLDFGIAKLLEPAGEAPVTKTATRLMTVEYASPEQVRGGTITTATDVYSLGVVLYEMLAGRRPHHLDAPAPLALERAICEDDPERPSAVAARSAAAARARGVRPDRLRRLLVGDLDTIALTALQKEPPRRYASVERLAEDIRRYFDGLPIRARPDAPWYRAAKFARRHRVGLAAAFTIVALTGVYVGRLAAERDRARREATRAEQVATFLKDLFLQSDPSQARGRTLTARELLDRGARRVALELPHQPETQAELMTVIGEVYRGLGLYPEARAQLESALAVQRRVGRGPDVRMAVILDALSVIRRMAADYGAAETLGRQAIAERRALESTTDTAFANSVSNLAEVKRLQGDYAAAESLYRTSLAMRRRLLPPGHRDVADNLNNLALVIHGLGNYAEAERMHREALALRRPLGEDHPDVSNSLNNLAVTLAARGQYAAAESLYTEALALRRRTLGVDEPRTLNTQQNLGGVLVEAGEAGRAKVVLEDALRLLGQRLAPDHPYALSAMTRLALALSALGARDSSIRLAGRALEMHERRFGPDHPSTLIASANLGRVFLAAGNHAAAAQALERALTGQRRVLPAGHPAIAETEAALARCRAALASLPR